MTSDTDTAKASLAAPQKMRVFVGVKVTLEIARELARLARDLEQFPVKLVARSDVHLTLVPPWNESSIGAVTEKLRLIAGGFSSFPLTFRHVGYGPHPEKPRLLWAECEAPSELAALRAALLEACGATDDRPFRPHVTIARLREKGRAIARQCPIDRDISFTQQVESIEFFRSPPPGAVGYEALASLRLGAGDDSVLTP